MQFSFVVDDLDKAINHWAQNLQVGPFFVVDHVVYERCLYQGTPSDIDMSVAIAYHGDLQIELVKQHNDAPSIFNQFKARHGSGLQHVAALSENLERDLLLYAERGLTPAQQGCADNGTKFAYLDCDENPVPGTMLELVELPDKIKSAFEFMRNAANHWNPQSDSARYK
jgi:hypothetical protein